MPQVCHPPLSGVDSIRLLRLVPHQNETADIHCELFNYSFQTSQRTHLYEALSYSWGDPDDNLPIFMNGTRFNVTVNLHAALVRLRNHSIERILWIDAICINQEDQLEKERQIQFMAKIYGHANRVLVWLGEAADDSDLALDNLRSAHEKEFRSVHDKESDIVSNILPCDDSIPSDDDIIPSDDDSIPSDDDFIPLDDEFIPSDDDPILPAVLALLQRPWFRRMWILQEVAAARSILFMCGYRKIDGFVFCLGIDSLQISYRAGYDIQNLIRSTTYLIREAIFRSDYSLDSSSRSSLNILPLGELIDMYHSREATNRHDKVYALLGMSSDDLSKADLSPNYGVSWEILLQRLVKYLIPERTSVETWGDKEIAVIQSKGYVLGKVISVQKSEVRGDRNCVEVSLQEIPMQLKEMLQNGSTWIFQISAQTVKTGDFICLFKGASRPSIIRLHKDYSTIIMVAVPLSERRERKNEPITWPMHSLSGTLPSRNFLLVWNWETPPEYEVSEKYEDPEEYEIWLQRYEWRWEHSKLEIKNPLTRAIRTWNVALILGDITSPWGDSKEEREADYWGHDAMGNFETAIREERLLARKCQHGQTPLWCAEEDKYKVVDSVVNLLLTYDRIALDLKDEHYIKPLLVWVVQGKHEIIIKLLLETGKIEIDAKDQDERTPLWWAAQGGHETMVQLLLDTNKVDVDLKDNQLEQAPLSVAAQGGHEATVKLLLNYGKISVDSKDKNGKTPLWWAAWEGHKAAVQLLLKTGKIDVDFKGSSQRTALSAAAEKGHEEVVKMLLKTGKVDVNSKDYDNRTPLLLASENGHATVVKLLLETVNVEVNIKHRYGWTALSQAVDRGHEAVVKLLLDTGNVDVASKDDSAKTPLL